MYNGERYIADCYKCLDNQTYKNLEIIFINDGSKDNTKNFLDELAKKDSRIVVIHKENGGVSSARNAGLDIAKGEYISFYDVDDQLDSRFFEVLLNDICKYNVDIAVCQNTWSIGNKGTERHPTGITDLFGNVFYNADQYYEYYYKDINNGRHALLNAVWGRIYKAKVIYSCRFNEDIHFSEDSIFWFKIISSNVKIYFDEYIGYNYVLGTESATGKAKQKFKAKCKKESDNAKGTIEVYNLCDFSCKVDTKLLAKKIIELQLDRIIFRLIRNQEKEYYKKNNLFFKKLIKEMDLTNMQYGKKVYLKLYLFSSTLCWWVSRCIAKLQKLKDKLK